MDERIKIADAAAGAAFLGAPWPDMPEVYSEDPDDWLLIGCALAGPAGEVIQDDDHRVAVLCDRLDHLAAFVRDFPTAPLEALYRHARSHGVHGRPSDGWEDVPAAFRIAYAVFRATLMEADRVFAEEEARAAAKAAADKAQAPVMVRASETILEQHGTIFEKVGDPDVMVNLGGPVVAEGESGDAAGFDGNADRSGDSGVAASDAATAGAVDNSEPTADAAGGSVDGGNAPDPAPDPANDSPGAPPAPPVKAGRKR